MKMFHQQNFGIMERTISGKHDNPKRKVDLQGKVNGMGARIIVRIWNYCEFAFGGVERGVKGGRMEDVLNGVWGLWDGCDSGWGSSTQGSKDELGT